MSLWSDDGVYMFPGHPVMRGKAAIRPVIEKLFAGMKHAGGAVSTFDFHYHCDAVTVSHPSLLTLEGVERLVMGSVTRTVHCTGSLCHVDGVWKVLTAAIVHAEKEVKDVQHQVMEMVDAM